MIKFEIDGMSLPVVKALSWGARLVGVLLLGSYLQGCIGSPHPGGATASLYSWGDEGQLVAVRKGLFSDEYAGFFDGDINLSDVLIETSDIEIASGTPYLLESCYEEICFYAVLFPDDFERNADNLVLGFASLNGLSTLMYYEVADLPAAEVRGRLNQLAKQIIMPELNQEPYREFIRLDLRRLERDRKMLVDPGFETAALAAVESGQKLAIADLIGDSNLTTGDLVASQDFVFSSAYDLSVDVDLSAREAIDYYLLICGDYDRNGEEYTVDYADCVVKTALREGLYSGTLRLTGDTAELLVTLMSLTDPADLEHILWQRAQSESVLKVR